MAGGCLCHPLIQRARAAQQWRRLSEVFSNEFQPPDSLERHAVHALGGPLPTADYREYFSLTLKAALSLLFSQPLTPTSPLRRQVGLLSLDQMHPQTEFLLNHSATASPFASATGQAFVSLPLGAFSHQVCSLHSPRFRDWLIDAFYCEHKEPPTDYALRQTIRTLEARALSSAPRIAVHRRIAARGHPRHPDAILLDLGNADGEIVEITAGRSPPTQPPPSSTAAATSSSLTPLHLPTAASFRLPSTSQPTPTARASPSGFSPPFIPTVRIPSSFLTVHPPAANPPPLACSAP
jgi:hypothetical protein